MIYDINVKQSLEGIYKLVVISIDAPVIVVITVVTTATTLKCNSSSEQ